jgi:multiple sugar transport system substrate-binding protein
MKRTITTALGMTVAVALALGACGSDDDTPAGEDTTTDETGDATDGDGGDEPITISLASWSLSTTPEFQTLADGFAAENPGVTVELAEYDAAEYDTQMIADLAAGTAPDVYVLKNLQQFHTYQSGEQLLDVSDVVAGLDSDTGGVDFYESDGTNYAVPYRQDSWVLFYNQDLFDEAGVDAPDGSWTWDDYVGAAKAVTDGLGDDRKGTYQHAWQSVVQGFALAQSDGADLTSGDYGYLAPYYERAMDLQDAGAQESFGTVTTNTLSYQTQFGTQQAAMLPMGTWYVATLVTQQGNGEADEFTWGMAPIPQVDASTAGTDATPVTFGDPTGLGINPAIDDDKVQVAKDFLAYAAGEGGAAALAGIGITPALLSDGVVETYFALDGVPTDELSEFAYSTHDTRPENPVSEFTAVVQSILGDAHSAIMSESDSIADAITGAESRAANEAGLG